ncbi:MAG: EF-hand domain-containing protein [Acidobacteria bacterium]|nr:EF-hand domain-containing protein [Acidobacteriota bacterium]
MRNSLLFITLSLSVAAVVQGQRGPQVRPLLVALDVDKNGLLSAAEVDAAAKSILMLDLNGDGQLTQDEFLTRTPGLGASPDEQVKLLMSFDRDGDGMLTSDELPERMRGMLRRGDRNHDGKLTAEEIRAMAQRQSLPAGRDAKPGSASGFLRADFIINALDTNHDGVIEADEVAHASVSLRALDVNHDGTLSAEEIRVRPQTAQERVDHMLGEWDTDKDGKIAKAEAPDRMQERFDTLDLNHDGYLTNDELIAFFSNPENMQPRPNTQAGPNSKEKK